MARDWGHWYVQVTDTNFHGPTCIGPFGVESDAKTYAREILKDFAALVVWKP